MIGYSSMLNTIQNILNALTVVFTLATAIVLFFVVHDKNVGIAYFIAFLGWLNFFILNLTTQK